MSRLLSVFALSVFAVFALQDDGCGGDGDGCDKAQVEQATFAGSVSTLIGTIRWDEEFSCFPFYCTILGSWSVGCGNVAAGVGKALVGFQSWSDTGTLPCTCMWYRHCYYRGWAQFDLSPLAGKTVLGAELKWGWFDQSCFEGVWAAVDNTGGGAWSGVPVIAVSSQLLLDVDSPPTEGATLSSSGGTLAVGGTVFEWIDGTLPNRGFLFGGALPGAFASGSCLGSLGPVSLEVTFTD